MGSSSSKPVISMSRIKKHGSIDVDGFIQDIDDDDLSQQIELWMNKEIHIAITGEFGTGKSSFINAVRGLQANDKGAAPVGNNESNLVPTEYTHPEKENIKLWDLPGIGTYTYPNLKEYCKIEGGLKKYDAFLIFSKTRFTHHVQKLVEKVSKELQKPFICVCTNVDLDLKKAREDEGSQFNEASVMENIKKECLKNLGDLIEDERDIYTIYDKAPEKFSQLCRNVISKLIERRSLRFLETLKDLIYKNSSITKDEQSALLAQAKDHVDHHGVSGIEDFYHRQMNEFEKMEINLAITGVSGAGKSSFINAVRGLENYDDGAAPVGINDVTKKPTPYLHPNNKNIIFWDLPGIGTPTYPDLETYCKKIGGLGMYDAFLIFCQKRFTHHAKELAKKASKELKKTFFFIRTNVHTELNNAKDDEGSEFDEASALEIIKEDCLKNLKDLIWHKTDIFLIDNKVMEKYDFGRLIESISEALPHRKMECFILSLTNVTRNIIKRKAKLLKVRATVMAAVAACASNVPPVGNPRPLNVTLLLEEMTYYESKFGLPKKGTDKFKALSQESSALLSKYSMDADPDPFEIMFLSTSSFSNVHNFLLNCINDMEKVALDIWDEALSRRSVSFLETLDVIYSSIAKDEQSALLAQAKDHIDRHGVSGIEDFYHRQMNEFEKMEINLAITGNSGTGKSSFINAVRGHKAYHVGAAPVGNEETTIEPTKYKYQKHENIILGDLPGIGTPIYPKLKDYCENVGGLEKYDAFLIFCKTRFTQHDKELAEKVSQDIEKPFFFVRTNIKSELDNAKDDKGPHFNEKPALDKMKTDCLNNLKGLINDKDEVFLIDNKVTKKYDFDRLIESISEALLHRKMECFILSLTTVTRESIKRKANLLKARATKLAGAKSKRVRKDGPVFNIHLVLNEVRFYCHQFGFPIEGSDEFKALNKKSSDVILNYISINLETLIKDYGMDSDFITLFWKKSLLESWYRTVHNFLSICINDLEEVALDIWDATVKNSRI
ncbi:uncharacterized protein LOC124437775 [Xenia sp. Carnegie-2017]|uniref:uncharacterized protein LOC124437775 n=1 Tax=Xenia sp. Carnegie-2017 TaxID=2897299 RepID=UPI001F047DD5|nr:uncharacterized protein LOC124437775 [Xenia sp. Carnegie-2017]